MARRKLSAAECRETGARFTAYGLDITKNEKVQKYSVIKFINFIFGVVT